MKKQFLPFILFSLSVFISSSLPAKSIKTYRKDTVGKVSLRYSGKEASLAPVQSLRLQDIKSNWAAAVYNPAPRHKSFPGVEQLKKKKTLFKQQYTKRGETLAKTKGYILPVIGKNFAGNEPNGWFPNDNRLAISKAGFIVSVINSNLAVFDTDGSEYIYVSFFDLTDHLNVDLSGSLYDPNVLYDAGSDRFIIMFLNNSEPAKSKVIVGFSKSNDPRDFWNFYVFSTRDDLESDGFWFDYPNIGVSSQDLFVTGNLFDGDGDFDHPIILQIQKQEAYAGESIRYQLWSDIKNGDGVTPFTLVPVSSGIEWNYGPGIYLVSTYSGSGKTVQLYDITDNLSADAESLEVHSVATTPYNIGGNGFILDREEKLNASDCRVRSGIYLDGMIHFVFHSDYDSTGWNGINYNRMDVEKLTNRSVVFGNPGYDYCFPAVAWFGKQKNDKSVMIGMLCSAKSIYPQIRAFSFDDKMHASPSVLIKRGENYFGDYDKVKKSVRWGDYSGMVRNHAGWGPSVWLAGEYGREDKKRGTWIAELTGVLSGVAGNKDIVPSNKNIVNLFPNPSYDLLNIEFELVRNRNIEVKVFDIQGRLIKTLYKSVARKGNNFLTFNRLALASGAYFVRIESNGAVLKSKKFVVIH